MNHHQPRTGRQCPIPCLLPVGHFPHQATKQTVKKKQKGDTHTTARGRCKVLFTVFRYTGRPPFGLSYFFGNPTCHQQAAVPRTGMAKHAHCCACSFCLRSTANDELTKLAHGLILSRHSISLPSFPSLFPPQLTRNFVAAALRSVHHLAFFASDPKRPIFLCPIRWHPFNH